MSTDNSERQSPTQSRREFLKTAGLVTGGVALGGFAGFAVNEAVSDDAGEVDTARNIGDGRPVLEAAEVPDKGLIFLTIPQARVIQDLTARIFPSDDDSPGALEAGVVYYIDRQLAGRWGIAQTWYMEGPFAEGTPTQGWQYELTPREAVTAGVQFIEEHSQNTYGSPFVELTNEQQDEVVQALADGEVDTFRGIAADDFFDLIQQLTREGMYADPAWGGNHNKVGWRLKKYPGSYVSYRDVIDSEEFIELEAQALGEGHLGSMDPTTGDLTSHHDHQYHPLDPRSYKTHS